MADSKQMEESTIVYEYAQGQGMMPSLLHPLHILADLTGVMLQAIRKTCMTYRKTDTNRDICGTQDLSIGKQMCHHFIQCIKVNP